MKSAPDDIEHRTDPAPVGLLEAYENFAGRHRFGERKSLPEQPINWGVICFYGALLLVATVALVKLFAEGK
jgi:hypothetical protein